MGGTRREKLRWLGGMATAREIGLLRAFVCLLLWFSVVREDLASIAVFPREMAMPRGIMRLFWQYVPGYYSLGETAWMLNAFEWITGGFLLLAAVGLFTRVTVPVAFLCYVVFAGLVREYFWIFHQFLLPMTMLGIMSVLPCGEACSVDRLIRLARNAPVPDDGTPTVAHGLMRAAIWSPLAFGYFAAGVSKVLAAGIGWADGEAMRYRIIEVAVSPMHLEFTFANQIAALPSSLFLVMGLLTLVSELGYPIIYVSRISRRIVPIVVAGMHVGIFILQRILFLDLILLQLIVFPWSTVYRRLRQWLVSRGATATVLFDGWCPLCRRTVRVLSGCDLFGLLAFHDFRAGGLAPFAAGTDEGRLRDLLETEMAVYSGSGRRFGFDAYRTLATRLPIAWPLLPFAWIPGFSHAGRAVYAFVASRRTSLLHCAESCDLSAIREPSLPAPVASTRSTGPYWAVLASAAVVYATIIAFRIEYYPLTALQMFTDTRSDVEAVEYPKLVAVYADGNRERYFPENDAGILADLSDTRYRFRMIEGIESGDPYVRTVYRALIARHNERSSVDRQIERIELEQWAWNFRRNPDDASRGTVMRTIAIERELR
jgi:predicted DCC family thiol-disulfide oxidoreductase YuxK